MTVKRYEPGCAYVGEEEMIVASDGDYVSYEDYSELQRNLEALAVENDNLRCSVDHASGCIRAAEFEGLIDALSEKDGERLADLVHRRLCHSYLPVETLSTDAALADIHDRFINDAVAAIADSGAQTVGDAIVAVASMRKE